MKKNTMLVIILAVTLITLSTGLTILAITADANNKANKVEQIVLAGSNASNTNSQHTSGGSMKDAYTKNNDDNKSASHDSIPDSNQTEAAAANLGNTVKASDNSKTSANSMAKEKQKKYDITVEDGADGSNCNISFEQAVGLGLKAIEKKAGIDCSDAKVRVSRYDTNENVTWNCVAEAGKHRFEFRVNANTGKILSSNQYELEKGSDYVWILKSNGDTVEKKIDQQKIKAYKSLSIQADYNMNVEVQKGEYYSINAKYYGSDQQVIYEIEDDTLSIKAEGYSNSEDNETNTITVTIPENVTFKDIHVSLEKGNFTMEKVSANTIDVSLECGTLTMNKVTSRDSILGISTGNAELTESVSKKNSINIDSGNVQMDNCTSEVCKIYLDLGDAKLKGKFTGYTECITDMGSVELHCSGSAKNYNYMLETDLGKVSVNGKKSITMLNSYNGAANSINVTTDMGDAVLDFE